MSYKKVSRLAVDKVLICIAKNPYRHLIRRWNWKSACLSAFFRGLLIFLANLSAGGISAIGAMLAEVCYRGLTTGFFSALTQAFRFAQPVWAASVIPMVLVPLVADICEFLMHGMRGTQRLGTTIVASVLFSAISTLFEIYAMRHGTLIMGQSSKPLKEDLRTLPKLLLTFMDEIRCFLSSCITSLGKGWRGLQARPSILPDSSECNPANAAAKSSD